MDFFDQDTDRHVRGREALEHELHTAIANSDIRPYFQPLVDLKTKRVSGFEALARWEHASLGEVSPSRFIPIAEEMGLISSLTDNLLRAATKTATTWPGGVRLSFNISPVELKDRTLCERVRTILHESGLSPRRLEIEITESALVQDLEAAQEVLRALRDIGVRIALDDFGTGYSNLYHLRNFKVDTIKIDRSFVQSMGVEHESTAIIGFCWAWAKGSGWNMGAGRCRDRDPGRANQGSQGGRGFLVAQRVRAKLRASCPDFAALCCSRFSMRKWKWPALPSEPPIPWDFADAMPR